LPFVCCWRRNNGWSKRDATTRRRRRRRLFIYRALDAHSRSLLLFPLLCRGDLGFNCRNGLSDTLNNVLKRLLVFIVIVERDLWAARGISRRQDGGTSSWRLNSFIVVIQGDFRAARSVTRRKDRRLSTKLLIIVIVVVKRHRWATNG
jgi:hypothetical protein